MGINMRFMVNRALSWSSRLALSRLLVVCGIAMALPAHAGGLEQVARFRGLNRANLAETASRARLSAGRYLARHVPGLHAFVKALAAGKRRSLGSQHGWKQLRGEMTKAQRHAAKAKAALESVRSSAQGERELWALTTTLLAVARDAIADQERHGGLFKDAYAKAIAAGADTAVRSAGIHLDDLVAAVFDPEITDSWHGAANWQPDEQMLDPTRMPLVELHSINGVWDGSACFRHDEGAADVALIRRYLLDNALIRKTVAKNVTRRLALLMKTTREIFSTSQDFADPRLAPVRARARQLRHAVQALVDRDVAGAAEIARVHRLLLPPGPDDTVPIGIEVFDQALGALHDTGYLAD